MVPSSSHASEKSRLGVLLEHFSTIDDPRDVRPIAHPLAEVLLLVVCGTMADCDDCGHIAAWGEAHLEFLRRHLPYEHGVPGGRWLTILINRINPGLFSAAFTAWVRENGPTARSSSPSTARPRVAVTIAPRMQFPSTSSRRSPPPADLCSASKLWLTSPTN